MPYKEPLVAVKFHIVNKITLIFNIQRQATIDDPLRALICHAYLIYVVPCCVMVAPLRSVAEYPFSLL